MKRALAVTSITLLVSLLLAFPAGAIAPPPNDLITNATRITLPYLASEDTHGAQPDGPTRCFGNRASVFFKFRPLEDKEVVADTFGADYDTVLSVWTGPLSALTRVACKDDFLFSLQSALHFQAHAGKRYFVMASTCCGTGSGGGGQLEVSVRRAPANPPSVTVNVSGGTTDAASGVATLSGTFDCNHRMLIEFEGTLRERVNSTFAAHGTFDVISVCNRGTAAAWTADVPPDGDIAFAPGNAKLYFDFFAGDGVATSSGDGSAPVVLS